MKPTTALAKINFSEGNNKPEANKALTRTGIQKTLMPLVAKALGSLTGYDPMNNVAHARRTLRALMTIAIQPLMSMGAPRDFIASQLMEALDHALAEHAEKFEKAALADGKGKKALKDSND